MKFGKKGQGLSLETIIVAIIVLFVLVVLLLIFTGRLNIFAGQTGECGTNGGNCYKNPCGDENGDSKGRAAIPVGNAACEKASNENKPGINGQYCCSKVSATGG